MLDINKKNGGIYEKSMMPHHTFSFIFELSTLILSKRFLSIFFDKSICFFEISRYFIELSRLFCSKYNFASS